MKKIEVIAVKTDRLLNQVSFLIPEANYNYAAKLLRKKDIRVNDVKVDENITVKPGDKLTVFVSETRETKHYETVFEDENIIVVNKKKGIETAGDNSLESEIKDVIAVHRLDRNTEGLVMFAKSVSVKNELIKVFENDKIEKFYITEVVGHPKKQELVMSSYLVKDEEMAEVKIYDKMVPNAVKIKTGYKVLRNGTATSILLVQLFTGKTHQIRAHMAHLGHPILGDGKYGKTDKRFSEKTPKLFCHKLKFDKIDGKMSYLSNKTFIIWPEWYKK